MRKPYHSRGHLAKILISDPHFDAGGGGSWSISVQCTDPVIAYLQLCSDTGNVGSRYNQPFGLPAPPPPLTVGLISLPLYIQLLVCLRTASGLFVASRKLLSEVATCQINFFLHKLRSVKIFKILTKSCLHFKVVCLIFYQ